MARGHDGYTSRPKECADCGSSLPIPRGLRMARCRSCQKQRRNGLALLSGYRAEAKAEARDRWAICSAENCERESRHPGGAWCSTHQWRFSAGKNMDAPIRTRTVVGLRRCEVEGCESKHLARGYCKEHYGRWRRGRRGADLVYRKRRLISPERQARLDQAELIKTLKASVASWQSKHAEAVRKIKTLELADEKRFEKQLEREPGRQPLTSKTCSGCGAHFEPTTKRRMLCYSCHHTG